MLYIYFIKKYQNPGKKKKERKKNRFVTPPLLQGVANPLAQPSPSKGVARGAPARNTPTLGMPTTLFLHHIKTFSHLCQIKKLFQTKIKTLFKTIIRHTLNFMIPKPTSSFLPYFSLNVI
jgi:hypothetical protein